MTPCIDLKARFGKRFKVAYEESYHADRGDGARLPDPWLLTLPCQYGHIFPHGGDVLAASVDGHRGIARRLRQLPCVKVWQDGDGGELTVLFDVADFGQVARVMRPKRRRQVSEAQRARLRSIGFQSQAHSKLHYSGRECVPTAPNGPGAVQGHPGLFGCVERNSGPPGASAGRPDRPR